MENRNKKYKIFYFTLSVIFIFSSILYGQVPAPSQKQPIALVGGTIHTITGPIIENGTILFDKGKIVDLGSNINLPSNTRRININGKHVYPSMIEAHSVIGLMEVGRFPAVVDYAEIGNFNPNVTTKVAVNPESKLIPVARSNGVALALSIPMGGVITGKSSLLMLDGWTWEQMSLKDPVTMGLNWPSTTLPSYYTGQRAQQMRERMKRNFEEFKTFIKNAKAYCIAKDAAKTDKKLEPKFDPRLEAMIPVIKGELPFMIEAGSLDAVYSAIEWAERENFKIIISGARDLHFAANVLKAKNIPVIVGSILRNPSHRDSDFDEPFTLPLKLYEAGVKFCIASGGASAIANLPYHAAKAASYGLPVDEAIKAITIYPAEILGVSDLVGSLEAGKDATFFVSNGNPLEISSNVEMLFIQGRETDIDSKHKQLYRKYKERYRQIKGE